MGSFFRKACLNPEQRLKIQLRFRIVEFTKLSGKKTIVVELSEYNSSSKKHENLELQYSGIL